MRIAGLVPIAIGLAGLVWGGVSWTTEKTVVDVGPIQARGREGDDSVPPIVGGIALVAGIVLLVGPDRRRG